MSISGVGAASAVARMPEQMEAPGPDNDGDSDDTGAVQAAQAKAPTAAGVGEVVDKIA